MAMGQRLGRIQALACRRASRSKPVVDSNRARECAWLKGGLEARQKSRDGAMSAGGGGRQRIPACWATPGWRVRQPDFSAALWMCETEPHGRRSCSTAVAAAALLTLLYCAALCHSIILIDNHSSVRDWPTSKARRAPWSWNWFADDTNAVVNVACGLLVCPLECPTRVSPRAALHLLVVQHHRWSH